MEKSVEVVLVDVWIEVCFGVFYYKKRCGY